MTGPLECRKVKHCDGRNGNRKHFKTIFEASCFLYISRFTFYVQSVILYIILQFRMILDDAYNFSREQRVSVKGQLKRRDKLISITRFWSPENSFEGIFEKFVFVFEIWAVEIFVFTDSEGFRERTSKCAFDTASHTQRSCDVRGDFWVPCK